MALTNTEIDAAVPTSVATRPSRALLNAALKELVVDIVDSTALTMTFATMNALTPANYSGRTFFVTDVGLRGSLWRCDGATFGVVGGSVVLARGHTDLTVTGGSTAEEDLVTYTAPAGLPGPSGQYVITHFWNFTNSANNKTMRVKVGGTAYFANVQTTSAIFLPPPTRIFNRNSVSSQIAFAATNGNTTVSTGTAATTGAVNTDAAHTIVLSGQKATGAETLGLYAYSIELIRP